MKGSVSSKREDEMKLVSMMIRLYCRKKHKVKDGLCSECAELEKYAVKRSEECPFMDDKTFCSFCKVHCYRSDMRERIRTVMKYSGPRLLIYKPTVGIRHIIETLKEKRRLEDNR